MWLQVTELGGLHVVGTERHESRRIDNQLRGRTGRQGDPGSTRFFLSLEDNIFRIFGGDKIQGLMTVRFFLLKKRFGQISCYFWKQIFTF